MRIQLVPITLAHLEAFVWIAGFGSVKRAALNLAQPTVSPRLRHLTEETRAVLFERGSEIQLTHEGEALLGHERLVSKEVEGLARIGLAEIFALVCLPSLLRPPALHLEPVVTTSSDLEPGLIEGRLHLALTDPSHDPHLRLIPLGPKSLTWAANPALDINGAYYHRATCL